MSAINDDISHINPIDALSAALARAMLEMARRRTNVNFMMKGWERWERESERKWEI